MQKRQTQKKAIAKPTSNPIIPTRPFAPQKPASSEAQPRSSYNLLDKPLFPIQAKLTIGQPDDKYEQEADRVAHQVVNQIQKGSVQRQEISEDEELRLKPIVQRQTEASSVTADPEIENAIRRSRGGGQPLAESIRTPMEQAFGADFSRVRVHADGQSDRLNRSIQARAFTTGHDVFFRQGAYQPGNRGGQELLAHELTHVVQQGGGEARLQRKVGKKPKQLSTDKIVETWIENEDTYQLTAKSDSKGWTKVWQLEVFNSGSSKGRIFIYFNRDEGILKPDGLEVPKTKQGAGYGNKLGQKAVTVMTRDPIKGETEEAQTISLNLVSPLSAHLSLKQLTITLNGSDRQDEDAFNAGQKAKGKLSQENLYDPAQFPQFWGRLAYLVMNNNVRVSCSGFGLGSDNTKIDDKTIKQVDLAFLLEQMMAVRRPGYGFVMDIEAPNKPKPLINQNP
jgi:hypothetical protein